MSGKTTCWLWLLGLMVGVEAWAAAPDARLDRTRIAEGETVTLIINVPGDSGGTPDLSPLVQDFELINSSQSMQMSMINGRSTSTRGWQFVLAPKRSGKLEIPALRVGSATTRPLALEVLPAAQAAQLGPAAPVLIEAEVNPRRPYVQQKVVYTVRLLSRVPLRQSRITEPQIADAIVEPLGRETEYSSQRDGQQYRVIERRYAIFPQRSGALTIEGPLLSAQLPDQNQGNARGQRYPGRDPFADFDRLFGRNGFPGSGSLFGQTRPLRLRANSETLEVQPQPSAAASPWLPAESLTLDDAWPSDPPQARVGEPITRTVAITAQGLTAAQLPDLEPVVPAGIKVYPDKPQSQARVDGDTLVAQKVIQFALVPAASGDLTLPEVRLAWWDTTSDRARVARLPARTLSVLPAAPGALPDPTGVAATAPPVDSRPAPTAALAADDGGEATGIGYWPWIAVGLALAWLVTTALWLRARRGAAAGAAARSVPQTAEVAPPRSGRALIRVEQACQTNDPAAVRRALLDWAVARWPEDPPRRLDALAERLGGDVVPVLETLDRSLYAATPQPWDGVAAWRVLSAALAAHGRRAGAAQATDPLPPLYPQGL